VKAWPPSWTSTPRPVRPWTELGHRPTQLFHSARTRTAWRRPGHAAPIPSTAGETDELRQPHLTRRRTRLVDGMLPVTSSLPYEDLAVKRYALATGTTRGMAAHLTDNNGDAHRKQGLAQCRSCSAFEIRPNSVQLRSQRPSRLRSCPRPKPETGLVHKRFPRESKAAFSETSRTSCARRLVRGGRRRGDQHAGFDRQLDLALDIPSGLVEQACEVLGRAMPATGRHEQVQIPQRR
jgi:hypothetical protein